MSLANDLNGARKERVKVQYYTGTEFIEKEYKKRALDFYNNTVLEYLGKIKELLE